MEFDRIRRYDAMGKGNIYGFVNELFKRRKRKNGTGKTTTE